MNAAKKNVSRDDSIDLPGLVRRRHLQLIIGTAIGIIAAVAYHFLATPIYQSETQILVMTRNSVSSDDGSTANEGQGVHQDILATHMELFASNRIIEAAITNSKLQEVPSIFDAVSRGVDPADFIANNLNVTRGGSGRGKEANIITATYRDISSKDCAVVLDALVESYQTFLGDTFSSKGSEAVDLISRAKEDLAKELKAHEAKYRRFRESIPMVFSGDQTKNPHQEKLNTLEAELIQIGTRHSEITSRIEVIEEFRVGRGNVKLTDLECLALLSEDEVGRVKILFDVSKNDQMTKEFQSEQPIRSEAARAEYGRLLELKIKEKTLSQKYGDDHPQVRVARDKIATMENFMASNKPILKTEREDRMMPTEILETYLASLKNDLAEHKKREAKLTAIANSEEKLARDLIRYELEDKAIQSESKRLNSLYDVIVERLRNVSISKDFGGYITEVISPPKPQRKAVWPRLSVLGALGSLAGLMLGVAFALLAELTDSTFRNPSDVQASLALPILGHIPRLQLDTTIDSEFDPTLCTLNNPRSGDAEVYRSLRTALSFSAKRDDIKVIQITSANPGEGKSTTAANLAVSFAQSGKSVLLIDADMRRPRVKTLFGTGDGPGLSEVIAGEADLFDAVRHEVSDGLSLLTAGRTPANPAELLSSTMFADLLKLVEEKYDYVILDTPPVLVVSDPRITASIADAVLITVRIVKDGRGRTVHCKELLESVGANLIGVVVNSVDERVGHYGYAEGGDYGFDYSTDYYKEETPVGVSS